MAPPLDLSAHHFAHRLDIAHQAFVTASIALKALVKEQYSFHAKYKEEIAAGLDPIEERDEDGHLLWSQDLDLELRIEDTLEALQSLHKATVISAYHVWEDATRRFTKKGNNANHQDLVNALKGHGIATHADLEWIANLVNLLKHGNPRKGRALLDSRPDLFKSGLDTEKTTTDWYGAVMLSSELVELVIERLGQSGPRAHP